jgi:hypothetical protein
MCVLFVRLVRCATLVPCYLLVGEGYRVAAFVACVRGFECVCLCARACAPHVCVYVVCARMCVCVRAHVRIFAVSSELRTRQTKSVRPRAVAASGIAACAAAVRVWCLSTPKYVYAVVSIYLCIYMLSILPVDMRASDVCVYWCVFICDGMCSACMRMCVPSVRAFCLWCVCVHDIRLCLCYVSCVNVRVYVVLKQCL